MNRSALTFRKLIVSYLPILATVVAIAMLIYFLPSRPTGSNAFGTSGQFAGTNGVTTTSGTSTGGSTIGSAPGAPGGVGTTGGTNGTSGTTGTTAARGLAPTLAGVAGSNWPLGSDCSRQKILAVPTCRPTPAWAGNNGGATYKNVSSKELRIVVYEPASAQQIGPIADKAGAASNSTNVDALQAYETYFNRVFETYGRHVKIIFQSGPGTQDPSEQIADAKYVVNTLHASIVMSAVGSGYFHDEVARLGIPEISGALGFPASYYQAHAPYLFSMFPDMDLSLDHFAEYYCKRLNGHQAKFAGDPLLQNKPRKLGIIWPYDNSVLLKVGPVMQKKLAACGTTVGKIVSYAGDVSTITQQATNVIAQMKAAGVTSITVPADPISPIFFTNAATNQGYFPEWISNGILLTDVPSFIRLYNQQQMAHYFGVSVQSYYEPVADGESWKAYFAGKPNGSTNTAKSSAGAYCPMLVEAFAGIEGAGPDFSAQRFANVLLHLPAMGGKTPNQIRFSFGANGPSPWTGIDNFMEFWWDPTRSGPDGQPGWMFYMHAGRRYGVGQWPRTEPQIGVDDGSKQPGRDPNA
jgi:hypothetical protein